MTRILFVISLLVSTSGQAQVPDYFADNPKWLEARICYDGQGTTENWDYVYYLNGDSTINGEDWQVVYKRGSYYSSGLGGSGGYTFNDRFKFIRQDGSKLYTLENGVSEMLLYDFSLNVGDTLPWSPYHWSLTTVIDSIQMVLINGSQRKKMFVSDTNYGTTQGYLIEGIGTHRGLFETVNNALNCGNQLVSFKVNNVVEVGSNCNFSVGIEDIIQENQLNIFPNPTSASITLEVPKSHSIHKVFLINSSGSKKELVTDADSGHMKSYDLSGEPNGFYTVEIHLNSGQILREKLVKI